MDDLMIVTFSRHGCKKFFKHYVQQRADIERLIGRAIDREVATGMTKVKLATRAKVDGLSCYEFRLNLGRLGSARIAFTYRGQQATVVFISHDLQKDTFSHEVDRVLGGS